MQLRLARILTLALVTCLAGAPALADDREDRIAAGSSTRGSPTTEECDAFAREFESNVMKGNRAEVAAAYDLEQLFARASQGIEAPAAMRDRFFDSVREGLRDGRGLIDAIAEGGSFRFLRIREQGGEQRAVCRLLKADGGFDFQEFLLSKGPPGLRIVDVWEHKTGELLSQSIRRIFIPLAVSAQKSLLERLTGQDAALVRHMSDVEELSGHMKAGRHSQALAVYARLPLELKRDRRIMIMWLTAASHVNEVAYLSALADVRSMFPGDPCAEFHAMDFHFLRKEHDLALAAVDVIDKRIGGDAWLDFLRGTIEAARGQWATARAHYQRSVDADPLLEQAWWMLADSASELKDYEAVYHVLCKMHAQFGSEWNELTRLPVSSGFAGSPWHAKWKEWLARSDEPNG